MPGHGITHDFAVLSQPELPFQSWFEKTEARVLHNEINAQKLVQNQVLAEYNLIVCICCVVSTAAFS